MTCYRNQVLEIIKFLQYLHLNYPLFFLYLACAWLNNPEKFSQSLLWHPNHSRGSNKCHSRELDGHHEDRVLATYP